MLRKIRKQLIALLSSPEVVLSTCPTDVIRVPEEVNTFIRSLYTCKIIEVHDNYYANPTLCKSIVDRAWVVKRRVPESFVACVQTAGWVYTSYSFGNKLVLNHKDITCITGSICVTDHSLFEEDIIEINNLKISSPERTLIDIIRYGKTPVSEQILLFKTLKAPYEVTEEKLLRCLERMKSFKHIEYVFEVLDKYGFIFEGVDLFTKLYK